MKRVDMFFFYFLLIPVTQPVTGVSYWNQLTLQATCFHHKQIHTHSLPLCPWNWTRVYCHLPNFTLIMYFMEPTWGLMVSALALRKIAGHAGRSLKSLIFVSTIHLCWGVSQQDAELLLASGLLQKGWGQCDPFGKKREGKYKVMSKYNIVFRKICSRTYVP